MRVPRVQFTVRRMMIGVAVVALLTGTTRAGWRWYYCTQWAGAHARLKAIGFPTCGMIERTPDDERYGRRLSDYHAGLEAKYLRSAWCPWEPIPPDPPRPGWQR